MLKNDFIFFQNFFFNFTRNLVEIITMWTQFLAQWRDRKVASAFHNFSRMEYGIEFALTLASLNLSFGGSDKGKYGCGSMDVMDDEVMALVAVTFKHSPATVAPVLEVVSCRDCCCCSSKVTVVVTIAIFRLQMLKLTFFSKLSLEILWILPSLWRLLHLWTKTKSQSKMYKQTHIQQYKVYTANSGEDSLLK